MCEACITTYAKMSKVDPTRTTTLRNAFVRDIRKRFTRLANDITRLIGKDNEFGLQVNVGQFDFPTSQDKVESFMQWLQGQVDDGFLEISSTNQVGVGLNDYWTNRYVTDSYQKGVIRARQEMTKAGLDVPSIDTTGGIGGSMSMPVHLDRLGILYTRTFNELKNITQAMSGQISRVLTQGLADGDNPRTLARKLVAVINGGGASLGLTDTLGRYIPAKRRAEILARTEIIRAHHMGMVQEYRNWGLEGVKVQAEWKTAGDDRVCDICAGMEGSTYTLDQIEKMIPAHPQCRCIALPSVVEEVKKAAVKTQVEEAWKKDPVASRFKDAELGKQYYQRKQYYRKWIQNNKEDCLDEIDIWKMFSEQEREVMHPYINWVRDIAERDWGDIKTAQLAWQGGTHTTQAMKLKFIANDLENFGKVLKPSDMKLSKYNAIKEQMYSAITKEQYINWRAFNQVYMETIADDVVDNTIKLYRGTDGDEGKKLVKLFEEYGRTGKRSTSTFCDDAICGYSSDYIVAKGFGQDRGGFVITYKHKIEDILCHTETMCGATGKYIPEMEYIVKGFQYKVMKIISHIKY